MQQSADGRKVCFALQGQPFALQLTDKEMVLVDGLVFEAMAPCLVRPFR